jgi:alpha-ketoglutarate-dependent taurine dioxygenase/pimeloyl-ACP methyl ester carboxylesterase
MKENIVTPTPPVYAVRVTPLGEALGAEVEAGNLDELSAAEWSEIRAAFARYHVLRFRGLTLDDERFDRFARRWGPPQPTRMTPHRATRQDIGAARSAVRQAEQDSRYAHIAVVSNVVENNVALGGLGDGELMWHSDQSNAESPPAATLLYALEAPSGQGLTAFLNTHLAWKTLPQPLQDRVRGLRLKHDGSLDAAGYLRPLHSAVEDVRTSPGQVHPLVCLHPENGGEAMYLGRRANSYLVGLQLEESEALLDELWAHAVQEAFIWRQDWKPGDLIIWDNRSVLHQRNAFDPTQRRVMHRIMIQGQPPSPAAARGIDWPEALRRAHSPREPLQVADIGSFHIGGRKVRLEGLPPRDLYYTDSASEPLRLNQNSDYHVEQMYAQYVRLEQPKARQPLLMVHGGRSTGVLWETTPDGRAGFQNLFLHHGHDVYLSDAVERGRSSWAPPQIWPGEPFFPAAQGTWDLSRIGPPGSYASDEAQRRAFEDTQFPVEAFDQQMKHRVPRWATNDPAAQAAYDQYVRRVGPCVLMAHSTGGPFALRMALNSPELVRALVLLEPAGSPEATREAVETVRHIPHLYIWGDHLDADPSIRTTTPLARAWASELGSCGGAIDWLDLPTLGIHGNTHLLMMDRNNAQIAQLIQYWLEARGLMR